MDWRGRKYYVVKFSYDSIKIRIDILKNINGVKITYPNKLCNPLLTYPDEMESRGNYHVLIGCVYDVAEIIEYELNKAKRRDSLCIWKEVKRDYSKKYFDVNGFEMPYKRCDINPNKRCNHCMNC